MEDNIIISRCWQDVDFFQLEIECRTEVIAVRGKVYSSNEKIDELRVTIDVFLAQKQESLYWQSGERGDSTSPCIGLRFIHKDSRGHILIEVFMEIDDGGSLDTHHCCFYINTETGLLCNFKDKLSKLKEHGSETTIALN